MIVPSMIGFWTRLPKPVKSISKYAGILLLAWWGFHVFWLNPHDNRIEAETRKKVTEEIRKDFEAAYQEELKDLDLKKAELYKTHENLEREKGDLKNENNRLIRSRETIVGNLNQSIAYLKGMGESRHEEDRNIPIDRLDGRLRAVSNELVRTKSGNIGGFPAVDPTGKASNP